MFNCHVRLAKGRSACKPTCALAVESLESHHSLLVNDRTSHSVGHVPWREHHRAPTHNMHILDVIYVRESSISWWFIHVRYVVPNNNRRYGKQPACNTEEQRFFGHNLDGTGYLGCRLMAKFGGCLIFPKLRLDSTVLNCLTGSGEERFASKAARNHGEDWGRWNLGAGMMGGILLCTLWWTNIAMENGHL